MVDCEITLPKVKDFIKDLISVPQDILSCSFLRNEK